jgi:hypothetical protein
MGGLAVATEVEDVQDVPDTVTTADNDATAQRTPLLVVAALAVGLLAGGGS